MYFKIQQKLLHSFTKTQLLLWFKPSVVTVADSKARIIDRIINSPELQEVKHLKPTMYFHYCGYCRTKFFLVAAGKATPLFCTICAKTTPSNALNKSFEKAEILIKLAAQMRHKNPDAYNALLEQSLVSTITSVEIMLRQTYSSIYDQKHIIYGSSLFNEVYSKSRNEFLNFGNAISKIKSLTGTDIKFEVGDSNVKLISKMYSTRHVIVHNASIKDKEYINQTNENAEELNKSVTVDIAGIKHMFNVSKQISKILDRELKAALLMNHLNSIDIAANILEIKGGTSS